MTTGNNVPGEQPQDDDPFAHLYRQEGGQQPAGDPVQPAPGVPRTSYTQVRAVGERTYGGQPQSSPHYAAPETYGGPPPQGPYQGDDYGYDRGPRNRNGLVVGAIAVVAVVALAIGAAMYFGGADKGDEAGGDKSPTATAPKDSGGKKKKPAAQTVTLPAIGAAKDLQLAGGASLADSVPGAKSEGGQYVQGMNTPGASATWKVKVPTSGQVFFYIDYGVPGKDQSLSLTVNGKKESRSPNMGNFSGAKNGDWAKGWTYTYSNVNLNKGENELKLSCESGDKCDVNLAQFEVRTDKRS
jgi:hypothetical protein